MPILNKYASLVLLCWVSNACALPFKIVPKGTLPTTIAIGIPVSAEYTITNSTKRKLTGNLVKWLPPHVRINYADTTCSPTAQNFNLNSGQSCLLSLIITGAVDAGDPDPHHHLFVCASDKASCAGPSPENSLNVTASTNKYAYVANNGNDSVSLCPLINDEISTCSFMYDSSFSDPAGIAITPTGKFLYVSNNENYYEPYAVSICPITTNGIINTCSLATDATFDVPEGMVVNPAGTFLYVANAGSPSSISACPINGNGTLASCMNLTDTTFQDTVAIALNFTGTRAYVVDSATDTISMCPIEINGSFSSCTPLMDNSFMIPEGIAINAPGTFAYVTNNNSTVSLCPINNDGTFATCSVLNGNFSSPEGIALSMDGRFAYITNIGNSTVSECPIKVDGTFGTCIESSNNLNSPVGIVLY